MGHCPWLCYITRGLKKPNSFSSSNPQGLLPEKTSVKKKTSFLPQQNSYGFSDRVPGLLKVVPGGHVRLTRRGLVGDSLALLKADWRHQNGRIFL